MHTLLHIVIKQRSETKKMESIVCWLREKIDMHALQIIKQNKMELLWVKVKCMFDVYVKIKY